MTVNPANAAHVASTANARLMAATAHHRRLRSVVKRLVIELAHVEATLADSGPDGRVLTAAQQLDDAIDLLNDYLATRRTQAA